MRALPLSLLFCLCLSTTPATALTLQQATRAALQNHQQIERSRANLERSQAAVGSARADFMPSVDLGYLYRHQDDNPFLIRNEASTLYLSASLNLFNGLADHHNYQASKHRATGADYQLKAVVADIILEARRAYIEVLRAARSIDTETEGVELLQRQQRDASLRLQHGVIARNELLRVEVELSNARQDLLRADGNYQIARRRLERVMGVRMPAEEKLAENSDPKSQAFDLNQVDAYRIELREKRSELNYLRELVAAAKREHSARGGAYLPTLDLTLSHEEYGNSLAPNGLDSGYDDDNILMLNANWNLFNGFASKSARAEAKAKVRALTAELRDTEADLLQQLEIALNEARIASGQREEAKIGVSQAEENYRVTENRYKQQQATTVDLLDAQFLLTRSRNLQVDARYNLYLTSAAMLRILERAPLEQ